MNTPSQISPDTNVPFVPQAALKAIGAPDHPGIVPAGPNPDVPPGSTPLRTEYLPFTIRVVDDETALRNAVLLSHNAYKRHVPELAGTTEPPELARLQHSHVILLAESKLDGSALGTMKIQINRHEPLALEQSVALPEWMQLCSLATANRLGVEAGRPGRMVKTALFKAFFQYCFQENVDWMVIAARSPLDRQYAALMFEDIYPERGFIPLAHAADIPHRLMALEVRSVQPKWHAAGHPLHDFFFLTNHPDIHISGAAANFLPGDRQARHGGSDMHIE